jgi:hypothetical protein
LPGKATIDKDATKIFDCGMNRPVCRDFIIGNEGNFICYKISTIRKALLANMAPRAFLPQTDTSPVDEQLSLLLNFEN